MNVLEYHQSCVESAYHSTSKHQIIINYLINNKADIHFHTIEAWEQYAHMCDGFNISAYNYNAFMEYAAECRPFNFKVQTGWALNELQ